MQESTYEKPTNKKQNQQHNLNETKKKTEQPIY